MEVKWDKDVQVLLNQRALLDLVSFFVIYFRVFECFLVSLSFLFLSALLPVLLVSTRGGKWSLYSALPLPPLCFRAY